MAKLEVQEKNGTIFCPLKNAWLIAKPEEKVRQRYICTLVNDYGYSLDQMAQEIKVTNSQRGQGKARADIVIWKNKSDKDAKKAAFIVVECKAENVKIHVEDFYQGFNYASWAHAEFFVTTNEKETKFFNVDPAYLPQKLEEVVAIPTAKDVDNAKKIEQLKNQTKTFTREEFTKTLQSCHNIIRNNDKLSPEAAFDEISKLLFMKIRYERQQKGTKVFTKEEYIAQAENYEKNIRPGLKSAGIDQPYMQNLFNTTKVEFKDDHLFEESDEIKIRENSFIQILEKLQNFNLSDTQDDVKGIAFEQFLGTTFRGELGQFFTPRTIVDFMTEILDPQEGEVICDPTCGSGGFLIKAFEYVREKIERDIKEQKDKLREDLEGADFNSKSEQEQAEISEKIDDMQSALNTELDTSIENSRMYQLSHNCIYGTDANPRMARTCPAFMEYVAMVKPKGMKTRARYEFIKNFNIPVPSLPVQQKILDIYHTKLGEAEDNIKKGNNYSDGLLLNIQSGVSDFKKEVKKENVSSSILQIIPFTSTRRWEVGYIQKEGRLESVYNSFKYTEYRIKDLQVESLFGLSVKASLEQKKGMIPVLRMSNVINGELDFSELKYLPASCASTAKEPNKWILRKGDFLITRTNGSKDLVGKSAVFDSDDVYTYASYLIRYRFDTSIVLPEYVNILFMTPLVREQIAVMRRQGGGQYNLNSDEIGAIRIPVPSIPIQQDIVKRFNDAKDGAKVYYGKADECKTNALKNFEKEIFL